MRKFLGLIFCLGFFPIIFALTGCGGVDLYMYIHASKYAAIQTGEYENIKEMQIDWISGSLTIKSGDVSNVVIAESGEMAVKKPAYFRQLEDGTIDIKYFKSGETRDTTVLKNLVITVPNDMSLKGIYINAPFADVTIDGVTCDDLKVTTNTNNADVKNSSFSTAKIVSGSGETKVRNCSVEYTLTVNPNTGKVEIYDCDVLDYSVYTYKGEITITLPDESFVLTTADNGVCNYEDAFGELVSDGDDGLIYGDPENIMHKVSFEATHRSGILNLLKK